MINLSKLAMRSRAIFAKLKRTSRDYLKTLKSFIKPSSSVTIPPLLHENNYVADSDEKANLLNSYFVEQTVLDEH